MNLGKIGVIVEDRSPGMLQSIGFQKVGQGLATEQQQQNKISLKNTLRILKILIHGLSKILQIVS